MADVQGALATINAAPVDDDLRSDGTDPALAGLLAATAAPYQTTPEAQERSRSILDRFYSPESTARQEEALQEMRETAETSRKALQDAKARLLGQPVFDERSKWLKFAAAMSRPTRTGAFAESVGFGAESLAESLDEKRAAEQSRSKSLLELETQEAGIDERLAALAYKDSLNRRSTESDLAKEALKTLGKSIGRPGSVPKSVLALDKVFVKEMVDWTSQGRVSAQKSLSELSAAINVMDNSDTISGPYVGLLPKGVRDVLLPESGNVQDLVELTASQSLRDILGGAFARVEGEALLQRTFNPRLEEHVNKARARRLMEQIADAAAEKDRQTDYFRQNGTLSGYQPGPGYDFERMMDELGSITEESLESGVNVTPGIGEKIVSEEISERTMRRVPGPDGRTYKVPSTYTEEQAQEYIQGRIERDAQGFAEGGEVEFEEETDVEFEAPPSESSADYTDELVGAGVGATAATGISELRQIAGMNDGPGAQVKRSLEDPEAALRELAQRQQSGVPATLTDVGGPQAEMLTEKALGLGGEGASDALNEIDVRHEGARERVGESVKGSLEASPYFEQEQKLINDLRENGRTLYKAAYKAHPGISEKDVPGLQRLMETPDGKKAVKIALRVLRNRGRDIGKKDAIGMVRRPSLEFLDLVKRGMDQLISKEERKGGTTLGGSMRELRTEFRDQLDAVAPEYTKARETYAGDLEVRDAIRAGRSDFKNMQPEELVSQFAEMSDAEKTAYRSGVAQHLIEQIDRPSSDANPAQKVIGSPAMAKRLRAIFPDETHFEVFQEAMRAEADMFAKERGMKKRGETARAQRLSERRRGFDRFTEKVTIIPVIGRFPVLRWALRMIQNQPDMSEKEADKVLEILRNRDVDRIRQLMDESPMAAGKRRGKAALLGAGVGALAGSLTGEDE